MKLYLLDITDDSYIEGWESLLDETSCKRILGIKNENRRKSFIAARLILKKAFKQEFALEVNLVEIENSAPTPIPPTPFFFGISHSGNFVGVIISNSPVALDIEVIRDRSFFEISDYAYCSNESKKIRSSQTKYDVAKSFYEIWTLREALYKLTGWGPFGSDLDPMDYIAKQNLFYSCNYIRSDLIVTIVSQSKEVANYELLTNIL